MRSDDRFVPLLVLVAALFTAYAPVSVHGAEEIIAETGYLELEQGFVGDRLGAEIKNISVDESGEFQTVDIAIPVQDPGDIHLVEVIGPAGKTIPQFKPAKITRDQEGNNVGVKLFLSQKKSWLFKVRLAEQSRGDSSAQ